jgi:DNA-binding CsgD family transcriptional regulator
MTAVSPAVKHRLRFAGMYGQPLTPADLRVLRLVACGVTDNDIARQINYAPATVKWILREIRARLGARDRAHAVALGYETGQLQPGTATPGPRP